ncbi:MAG: gamma-glutamyltransferase family protein [Phycisphaerales bacterium JB050]
MRSHTLRTISGCALIIGTAMLGACASVSSAPSASVFERPESSSRIYRHGAVACDHPVASRAGATMLELGGNAVDAAIAASFTLSVVRPYSCGIGGGGFMVVHLTDDPTTAVSGDPISVCIDYRERAPMAMEPTWFEDRPKADSRLSGHAVGVPGTVAGLLYALETYGTLSREQVMAPAIRAAREGFDADAHFVNALNGLLEESGYSIQTDGTLSLRPGSTNAVQRANAMHLFWRFGPESNRDRYEPVEVGDRLTNLEQARVLEAIAEGGVKAFYEGPIARRLVDAVQDAGGPLALADLSRYKPVKADPLEGRFNTPDREFTILGMPLPSSGGITIVQTLGIFTQYCNQMQGHVGTSPLEAPSPTDPDFVHAMTECLKQAFANRALWLADPETETVPVEELLSAEWFEEGADRLHPERAFPTDHYGLKTTGSTQAALSLLDDSGTSHLSVVDQWGNAVACTETINLVWGSRVLPVGLGFCLNNEIDDFTTRRDQPNAFGLTQSEANLPAPGKRPLSSMSPTIVLDSQGRVVAVAGASGGPRIITGTLEVLLHTLLFGDDAWTAVARGRFHHQWLPDQLRLEPALLATQPQLQTEMEERKQTVGTISEVGVVQLIRRVEGGWQAASDPRKGGEPAGH